MITYISYTYKLKIAKVYSQTKPMLTLSLSPPDILVIIPVAWPLIMPAKQMQT
jgi:hypothetical protein